MDTKQLKQKILDLAIRGKLVPQDPNDEPASVLLERIRKEKEQLIASGKLKKSKSKTTDTPHYENVPFEIPDSWEWVQLKDITTFICDGDWIEKKDQSEDGIRLIQTGNVGDGWFIDKPDSYKYISNETFKRLSCTEIFPGDILISRLPSPIGRSCELPQMNYRMITAVDCTIVRLKDVILKRFFMYYTQSSIYHSTMSENNFITGTTRSRISRSNLEKILIPIPPTTEQKRIIAEIDSWFILIDTIENNKRYLHEDISTTKSKVLDLAIHGKLVPQDPNDEPAIELLRRINPSFKPCDTSHYENLPEGWTVLTVGEVADYINGRAFKPSEWEQTGLPIIRIQNLNDEEAAYNYSTAKFEDKYLVHNGDLLFAWAASLGTYIWQKEDAWLNQHIFKVIPKPFIVRDFLYYSFINMIDDFYAESHGSGMVHITKGKFETRPILIPPLAEQKRIVEQIETIYAQLDTITAEL